MTFLTLQGVSKHYGPLAALEGIDLSVPAGSRTAIVGPSGSGKTTLLRVIAGFETPDTGRITLAGELLTGGPRTVPPHRRGIGFTAQEGAVFPHLSVAQNIGFGLDRNLPGRDKRILELMEMVELDPAIRDRRPHELSGGQQQRVARARARARKPKLMLLDEPFSALDTGLRESMRRAVAKTLRAAGITTILVTHDQAEALSFADQLAVLRAGRLVQSGSPRALYLRPRDPETATFLGDALILSAELENGLARCRLGSVAIEGRNRRGPAKIMLRPEQVRLIPVAPDLPASAFDPSECHGQVTDIEFGGAVCTIAVSLANAFDRPGSKTPAPAAPLLIRTTSIELPPVGTQVRIAVLGKAHVFDRE
jgi:iron(III) transport system ATP-binding protein